MVSYLKDIVPKPRTQVRGVGVYYFFRACYFGIVKEEAMFAWLRRLARENSPYVISSELDPGTKIYDAAFVRALDTVLADFRKSEWITLGESIITKAWVNDDAKDYGNLDRTIRYVEISLEFFDQREGLIFRAFYLCRVENSVSNDEFGWKAEIKRKSVRMVPLAGLG